MALLSNAMHQDTYARAFARHPQLRIVAVVDEPGQEPYVAGRNRSLAAQYGVPYVESLDRLSEPDVDVVSIGAQIERRAGLALEVARLGKPLWLDKPPAPSARQAESLAAAVDASGVMALVFSHLAAPWAGALRTALTEGEIGDLLALHLDFHFAKGDARGLADRRVPAGIGPRDVWTFRDAAGGTTDPTESSHHVIAKRELAEIGWYPLALAQHLCPQPVRRVYATAGAYFFPEHRDLGLEDFATLTLTLATGQVVTISTGRTGRRSHPAGRMAVRAAGTRGTLALDGGQPAVLLRGGAAPGASVGAPRFHIPAWGDSTGVPALVDHFVACLAGTATPLLTARQACELVRIIDAAYESVAQGQPVEL
ncbi:MAG: Gfo/Idh/MocA family oxidoreductase [Chloroflexi bacterium]|nr:Gfo/Idh/MocA family oxidoreductase [Chloroflexota bacterium]